MTSRGMAPEGVGQEALDAFYWQHGPCCAGCDWWLSINSGVGECLASEPVSFEQRWAMTGISACSLPAEAGHIITLRSHHCGKFKDDFDWSALPLAYLKRIGAHPLPDPQKERD